MCDLIGRNGRFAGSGAPARRPVAPAALLLLLLLGGLALPQTGCAQGARLLKPEERTAIDRSLVEYPSGYDLQPFLRNLTGATAMTFDDQGSLIIAEGGAGDEIRIYGFRISGDGGRFDVSPQGGRFPAPFTFFNRRGFRMYGPVGGLAFHKGKIYVSHRDEKRLGRITALDYDGKPTTIVAGLPAQGDYGVTDIAINPNGRLFFGVGAATNSGVVGLDNWSTGWVRDHAKVADVPHVNLKLWGLKFNTPNPAAGLFGGTDIAVTGPYQPFGVNNLIRVPRARDGKPTAAVYSVPVEGGGASELTVECYGVRMPRGLAFSQFGGLYMTNNGMELRGSRPVKDDPDVMLRMVRFVWYGWPDYSADLRPITDPQFQPYLDLILPRGYPELSFLLNHEESGLIRPERDALLQATFPSQSGAAKMAFVPGTENGPFAQFGGSAIIALSGDRAPFSTSGRKLVGPIGYKLVRVEIGDKQPKEFVRNVAGRPAHMLGQKFKDGVNALERPVDVKFGPDGALYILDMGRMQVKNGKEVFRPHTAQIFRLAPSGAATAPPTEPAH